MANNDKNFKVKNGLDVKGSATVDNDLLVSGTLTAQTNTPSADSDVVNKAYVDSRDTHDEAAVNSQIDSAFNVKSTTDLSEGDNLYYTTARADSAFDVRLATKTTTNLAEGDNLYYTTARADSDTRALVDSDYIEGKIKQSFIDTFDTHDSAAVQGQINATISATDTHDSAAVQGQIDSAVTLAFINGLDASATNWDSDLIPGLVLGTDVNGNYVVDVTGTANQIEVTHTQGEGSTPVIGLPNNVTIDSDLTVNGVIKGPSTMIIDPALHGDSSGTLVILGNLQVDGVSTIIQSNTVSITDKNIVLADSATNGTEANGAGITVNGANASITYVVGNDNWEFNKAPYYLNDRLLTTADDLHDSAAVQGQIDSAVTLAFINSLDASATDWDSDLIPALRTDDVNEGTNLYYTNARARASVSGNKGLTYNSSTGVFDIDSANIYSFTIDSARTIGLIDSAYVEARIKQSFIDTFDTHDSAAVVGQIGLEVTKTFVDDLDVDAITLGGNDSSYYLDYNNFTNTPTLPAQVISYDSASELADSAVNARTNQNLFTTSDVEFAKVTSNLVGSVHFTAQNDEGTALAVGDVVYIKGISGNTPTVAKADADDATKMPAFGIVSNGANNGANVTVTTFGEIANIDTSTFSLGDTLYVSTVAGSFTATKPAGETSLLQNVGQVTRVHSSGSIKVLGAGRTAATPNLDQNRIFIGNASNQSITISLDSAVDSDHVQSKIKQSFIDTFDTHDSAAVAGQIADTLNDTVTITKHSTTDPVLKLQSTVSTSDAAPIMEFVRNTDQANNGDYLGQIKFLGEDSSGTADGSGIVYAKMTGKISDPTDGTEDGLIEYMVKSNGENKIVSRLTGNSGGMLIMENGAGIQVDSGGITVGANGNITVAGNTVLTTASDTHDSAAVVGQINLEVDKAFVDALAIDYNALSNKPTIPVLGTDYVDSAEVNILIAAADTHDSAAVQGQIDSNFAAGFTVGGNITFSDSDDLILPDNSKIKVGDASDLEIYHDGNHSYIVEVGTGDLNINAQNLNLADGAPNFNYYFRGIAGGEVRLYHNGSQKLATKSTGVDVTGTITADGLTVDTNTLHVDATNDRVGINSTTPEQALHVEGQVVVDGGTGVSSTGVLHVRQNGDTSENGITITSSNAISHRIWKSAGGALSFGPSTDPDAFTQDLSGNITVAGEVFVDTLTPSTDSALASKAYVDANTSSASHTVAIGLLGAGLDVGDPVFYDSDAVKWVGAVDSDNGVASHIIVEKTVGVDFKIAQTGVFTLTPNQGLDINAYYFLGSTAGAATNTQPATGINQSLFYALDSSTIDINIAEATDLSAQSASSTITGTTAAAPAPNVDGDIDTGLFSASANTLSVSAGGTEISSFSSTGLEVKSGVGVPKYVSLSQGGVGAGVTYNIDAGNTASLTTDSDKTITLTTTGGDFTGLGGTSATLLIKNNTSPDSDRTMTFVTSSGNTLHFNSENTLTVAGGKISIVSAMVFGNNDLVLSAVSLDSSVTY